MFKQYAFAYATAGGVPNFIKNALFSERGPSILYEMDCTGGDCATCGDVLCPGYSASDSQYTSGDDGAGRPPENNYNEDDRSPETDKRQKIDLGSAIKFALPFLALAACLFASFFLLTLLQL